MINLFVSIALSAQTNSYESAENIRIAAKIFLEKMTNAADNPSTEVTIGKLDPRLRLRHCENVLQTRFPASSKKTGRVTLMVSCDGPVAWKVIVSATLYEYAEVVVAITNIARKTLISSQDIELKRVNISSLRKHAITNVQQVIGTNAKRYLKAGSIIFTDSFCLVCRGDIVQISAKNEFFSIDLPGIALADASIGENTRVRNTQSKRTISAKVIGKNQLEVILTSTNLN